MSRSELGEMGQLDELAAELAAAGRLARVALAGRERPEPVFALRLRTELVRQLPEGRHIVVDISPAMAATTEAIMPPVRPLEGEDLVERRHASRPFVGPDRRDAWAPQSHEWSRATQPWAAPADPAAPRRSISLEDLMTDEPDTPDSGRPTPLKPAMRWHIPTSVMPSKWMAVGLAACVAAASLIYAGGFMWSVRGDATADRAAGATLVRGGVPSLLIAGTELHEGDEIRVAATGQATLSVDTSYVRMAGGADLKLASLDPHHIVIDQITGRVYHRVTLATGGDYKVATASVTWTAMGTAFDLDRHSTSGGGEEVRGLALYDGLDVHGPQVQASLVEGMSATIVLTPDGSAAGAPAIEPITTETLTDGWLVANADLDAHLGLPLGRLAALLSPAPTAPPTAEPTPTATEQPSASPTAAPTAAPTAEPVVVPEPVATPRPTTAGPADLGALTVTKGSGNSYSFSWPKYTGSGFSFYKLVHEKWGKTPSYPSSPYWTCNTSPTDRTWTGSLDAGDYAVRLQVVDESNGKTVIRAQTNVVRVTVTATATPTPTLPPTIELGALTPTDNHDGTYTFSWAPYTGGLSSYYKLVYEPVSSGQDPSYPNGSHYWYVPGTSATSVTLTVGISNGGGDPFLPGDYLVRIQAIGYPGGTSYAYAQTAILTLTVSPPATPTPTPTATPTPTPTPTDTPVG